MLFNTIDLSPYLRIKSITGRGYLNQSVELKEIALMDGAHFVKRKIPVRVIKIVAETRANSRDELRKKLDELNSILSVKSPVPVVFPDEQDRTYYAIPEASSEDEEVYFKHTGEITLLCPDPYKYGPEQQKTFALDDTVTIDSEGTEDASPIFDITVNDFITHFDLVNELGEYMRVGTPAPADKPEYEREVTVFDDYGTTTTGWAVAPEVDNGYVEGEIIGTPNGFIPNLFGGAIQPYQWQGPSLIRSIDDGFGNGIGNFKLTVWLDFLNVGNGTGMIEVYLRDAGGNIIAKIGIEDIWRSIDRVQVKMQLGNDTPDRYHYYRRADYDYGWNDFKGMMQLFRDDSTERRIRPYFALVYPDGTHDWVSSRFLYVDEEALYQEPVRQIQFAFRVWAPETNKVDMLIKRIRMNEYRDQPDKIPYLAQPGDKIIIDTKRRKITKNGEDIRDEKEFFADYFKLKSGLNVLYQFPKGKLTTKVRWQDKYV